MTDYNQLYGELQSAIEHDKRYWIRNDAKIRASATSKNYDEFKQIVDTAHLSSLSREDKAKKYVGSWNKSMLPTERNSISE